MKGFLVSACLMALLLAACAANAASPTPTNTVTPSPTRTVAASTPVASSRSATRTTTPRPSLTPTAVPTGCATEAATSMGASIADSYGSTSPQQVMGWYCAGDDFEDILSALETEDMTSIPAADLLEMRSDGWTWEEIWTVTGFYDQ